MATREESQAELEAVAQAMAERTTLTGRLEAARARVAARERDEGTATDGLASTEATLRALEHVSWTWLRTSFTGRRTEQLMVARTAQAVETSRPGWVPPARCCARSPRRGPPPPPRRNSS